jgi:hypothetical protein
MVLGAIFKNVLMERKRRIFETGVKVAFFAVNEIARHTPNKIDDKVAIALKYLSEFMGSHNVPLKAADVDRAKLMFNALNAETNG